MSEFKNDFVYIAEQTTPVDAMEVKEIKEVKKDGIWYLSFMATLQTFNTVKCGNNRAYLKSEAQAQLNGPYLRSRIDARRWYGEQGHPVPMYEGQELSHKRFRRTLEDNCSHCIVSPYFEGDVLKSNIETLDAWKGPNMRNEIIRGAGIGFSIRVLGGMVFEHGRTVIHLTELITYDWVNNPSFKEAEMTGKATSIHKSEASVVEKIIMEENNNDYMTNIMTGSQDVFIPLGDIKDLIVNKDENTGMILESWNMDENNIDGITKDGLVQFSKGNDAYMTKITNNTKYKIMDYLSSL